jgi:predicted neutral ceramidase superfamily lipid hydrolase
VTEGPAAPRPATGWLLVCLAVIAVGLLLVAIDQAYRTGAVLIGTAVLLAGWLRAFLSEEAAGLLAVRRRSFDVAVYLLLGVAIVALALVVPA